MKRTLPKGTWVVFHDLDLKTTDQDLQHLIAARTGVTIPLERISVATRYYDKNATVSLEWCHVADILAWALGEDSLHGKPINIVKPESRAA